MDSQATPLSIPHDWLYPPSLEAATKIQRELAERVIISDQLPATINTLGGMDVSNNFRDPEEIIYATVILLDAASLTVQYASLLKMQQKFPYITGFLGFREAPALVDAFAKLTVLPDVIFVDGHGISHPRGLGIASHIGVLLDRPTIGVAKSILIGKPEGMLDEAAGSQIPLLWKGNKIATVLRSKHRCNPLYIAPGHKVSHETAVKLVMQYSRGYRLPEPTRLAHNTVNDYRRKFLLEKV